MSQQGSLFSIFAVQKKRQVSKVEIARCILNYQRSEAVAVDQIVQSREISFSKMFWQIYQTRPPDVAGQLTNGLEGAATATSSSSPVPASHLNCTSSASFCRSASPVR